MKVTTRKRSTPKVSVFPRCSTCHKPHAYKRVSTVLDAPRRWQWVRDCTHHTAKPENVCE